MKSRRYEVERMNIYAGEVMKVGQIYSNPIVISSARLNEKEVHASGTKKCRSILFTIDENNFSNDLLYNSPAYPILNMTECERYLDIISYGGKDIFYHADNSGSGIFVINNILELGSLLRYLGFDEQIDYKQMLEIRKLIFSGTFSSECSAVIKTHFRREFLHLLDLLSRPSLEDCLNNQLINRYNVFTPSKAETHVRKLSLF